MQRRSFIKLILFVHWMELFTSWTLTATVRRSLNEFELVSASSRALLIARFALLVLEGPAYSNAACLQLLGLGLLKGSTNRRRTGVGRCCAGYLTRPARWRNAILLAKRPAEMSRI